MTSRPEKMRRSEWNRGELEFQASEARKRLGLEDEEKLFRAMRICDEIDAHYIQLEGEHTIVSYPDGE